ncbi:MAG: 30S ribosomal protein S16 [Patescibacteria group bacterium]|jgi:small subunit ribosomal protein S16
MLKIRLTRVGKKNSPAYRVVVAEQKKAVQRKFIEILGNYNPVLKPKQLVIDKERALFWMSQGAQPSDTVNNLMVDLGILSKDKKIKKVFGKATKKKDEGKEPEAPKAEEAVVTAESAEEAAAETPAEEAPAEESKAEEPVVEEPVAPETPVEETPAEEPVTETEAPVEESPEDSVEK